MLRVTTVNRQFLDLFQPYYYIFKHANIYSNDAETNLKLLQAVSVFCFSFISECADVWNKEKVKNKLTKK